MELAVGMLVNYGTGSAGMLVSYGTGNWQCWNASKSWN